MIIYNWYASLTGSEQAFYWGPLTADQKGSRNYPVKSKQVDRAIEALTEAQKREDFVTAARALDRLLMGGHYVVPLYNLHVNGLPSGSGRTQLETCALWRTD